MRSEAELDRLIAEFSGFFQPSLKGKKLIGAGHFHYERGVKIPNWLEPGGLIATNYNVPWERGRLPNFTHPVWGIALLFKWAVPKACNYSHDDNMLILKGQGPEPNPDDPDDTGEWWEAEIEGCAPGKYFAEGETLALALARAIEKLIDGEEKDDYLF